MLAMHPAAIHSGPQGFFWLFGGGAKANERKGSAAIVHIRDGLEHHDDSLADNYESIASRVEEAMAGASDEEGVAASPPKAVILAIDSPGGVVSGLNETVAKLKKMSRESKIPLIGYANEMAASAAYALCCACEKVYCPASAIIGSIGVISTMVSQSRKNKADGIDVELITSGERKADGHVHAPITSAAVEVERGRVMKLATEFWRIAGEARGIKSKTLESYQAAIYLGKDAAKRHLVDRVMSLDDLVSGFGDAPERATPKAGGNETDRRLEKTRLTQLGAAWQAQAMAHVPPRRT
jgi:ClpP class serine protease